MEFKVDYKKFIVIIIIILLVWISFIAFLINYAKELKDHPCSMCAEKIGQDVICYSQGNAMEFGENGSIFLRNKLISKD